MLQDLGWPWFWHGSSGAATAARISREQPREDLSSSLPPLPDHIPTSRATKQRWGEFAPIGTAILLFEEPQDAAAAAGAEVPPEGAQHPPQARPPTDPAKGRLRCERVGARELNHLLLHPKMVADHTTHSYVQATARAAGLPVPPASRTGASKRRLARAKGGGLGARGWEEHAPEIAAANEAETRRFAAALEWLRAQAPGGRGSEPPRQAQ
jgi:hypothetical protein